MDDAGSPALALLRGASARVAELAPVTGPDEGAGPPADRDFDAAEHAVRFEELHEALAAVLDELDRD